MLSSVEILSMRAAQETAMQESCTVTSGSVVDDGLGGFSTTFVTSGSCVCRLGVSGLQPQEKLMAEKLNVVLPYVVTVPVGTAIEEGERLIISGRTYEVKAVLQGGLWETALRVMCAVVK